MYHLKGLIKTGEAPSFGIYERIIDAMQIAEKYASEVTEFTIEAFNDTPCKTFLFATSNGRTLLWAEKYYNEFRDCAEITFRIRHEITCLHFYNFQD